MDEAPLQGCRLLLVEDEYLIATDILAVLEDAGATVLGPVSDVERAVEVANAKAPVFHAAVLDINLNGEQVFPAAQALRSRRIPFVFVTGYECSHMPEDFRGVPCLGKPFSERELIDVLSNLVARRDYASGDLFH